ncbi:MAG: glycosyltransferase [Kiritimatiellia bacterium]
METVDFFRCLSPNALHPIEAAYLGLIRKAPVVWKILYDGRLAHWVAKGLRKTSRRRLRPFREVVSRFAPDAVICTQAGPFLSLDEKMNAFQLGVITDFIPHRLWAGRQGGMYTVPTAHAARRLSALGIRPERIQSLGIPVQLGAAPGAGQAGLNPREPRVLVMGGGYGLHLSLQTVKALDASRVPFALQVVTGRNESLRAQLESHRASFRHPVEVRGYVDDVPDRMRASALIVTKSGGLTTAEALALRVPLLLLPPLPGQETYNRDYLVTTGAAVPASPGNLGKEVTRLLESPALLADMRDAAGRLGRPHAAMDAARLVLKTLS